MGVEDYLLASSLLGVLAQRLVRRVCSACKQPITLEAGVREEVAGPDRERFEAFEGKGCELCANTGYRGRAGIYELLLVNENIRQLILKRSSSDVIRDQAVKLGMRTLRDDGWRSVRQGITTVPEVVRVTNEEV
jgi:type II secretory ATPase GspE/PulE/Tfp pilus assembly ATPase PilB-like protein